MPEQHQSKERAMLILAAVAHRAGFDYDLSAVGSPCSANELHVKVAPRVTALKEKRS
jgi:hypothetical protein